MRIVFCTATRLLPPFGISGAAKVNAALVRGLAARGHEVHAVLFLHPLDVPAYDELLERHAARVQVAREGWLDRWTLDGFDGRVAVEALAFPQALAAAVRELRPDLLLVTGSASILHPAQATGVPSVFFAQDIVTLPFGPLSDSRRLEAPHTRLIAEARLVLAASRFCADYVKTWGKVPAEVVYVPAYEEPPPRIASREGGFVMLFNPSLLKGLPIFLGLAQAFPEVRFAAVPLWATTEADRQALAACPNVTILEATHDVDSIYAQTRVLLLPSLVPEVFPMTTIEGMLRGIPVLASDLGGSPEAKLGCEGVLSVPMLGPGFGPEAVAGAVASWAAALAPLIGDPAAYVAHAAAGERAARAFVASLDLAPVEALLERAARGV